MDYSAADVIFYIRTLQIRVGYSTIYEMFVKAVGGGGEKVEMRRIITHPQHYSIPHTHHITI